MRQAVFIWVDCRVPEFTHHFNKELALAVGNTAIADPFFTIVLQFANVHFISALKNEKIYNLSL